MTGSSLREFDSPADRIRQHRQADPRFVILVEGPDDELVLRNHVSDAVFFPVAGKKNVRNVADKLLEWGVTDLLCVVDRDFDGLTSGKRSGTRMLAYPCRDLEAWLIDIGVLGQVLEHLGSREKIDSLGGVGALVAQLVASVRPLENLRCQNSAGGHGLAFDLVDLCSKVDRKTGELQLGAYLDSLCRVSDSTVPRNRLSELVTIESPDDHGPRGKDVLSAACVALRSRAGSLSSQASGVDLVGSVLRSSSALAVSGSTWLRGLLRKKAELSRPVLSE